jgi:hypothetical protein
MRADAVSRTGQGEYKMAIEKSGNDSAGTMAKLVDLQGGEWVVTHAVRAILTSAQGLSGALASLSVTGIDAGDVGAEGGRAAYPPGADRGRRRDRSYGGGGADGGEVGVEPVGRVHVSPFGDKRARSRR